MEVSFKAFDRKKRKDKKLVAKLADEIITMSLDYDREVVKKACTSVVYLIAKGKK